MRWTGFIKIFFINYCLILAADRKYTWLKCCKKELNCLIQNLYTKVFNHIVSVRLIHLKVFDLKLIKDHSVLKEIKR